ncbi:excinuclease ABC subunit C [Mesoplasma syrphidae]|uniref:UvrABC system protein C n=1 Tax=Mesoplasma syrphidae TaxID=225999 RepID=A0A2K9C5X9_9MOLU|nr:excinuclease ABC subunit UvrC [Mesoplasma syrphidae]AUF83697.1 excinuclease ABC subunit C [Mesoplasma syrphidae]
MNLEAKIKNLPDKPGCYIYYNKENQVIYVGKAKRLKRRVASYFNRAHNIKTTRLVREITNLDYFVVNNEKEALVLEENLIKKYRPRFNVLLNDDKSYPYIIITNESDPQYKYIRKYDKKALRSYGPLPQGSNAREILITLKRLFPLRRCKGNLNKPCLYYHINQCSGACFKVVDYSYYQHQIRKVDKFFKGDVKEVENSLKQKMQAAADNLQFEEAQRIKEQLNSLNFITTKQTVELRDDKNRDVITYLIDDDKIVFVTLFYRLGKLLFKDEHIQDYYEQDTSELLSNYINQIYDRNMLPNQIIIPQEMDFENLRENIKSISTHPLANIEKTLLELAENNAKETMIKTKLNSQSFANNEVLLLEELQSILGLEKYPYHIEMFDISNIGNEFVTGSCVVYKDGKPSRNDFRKYNIEIEQPSDYERLKNMIYRRYQKALVEKRDFPDLIIMDGGIIQVHAAKEQIELLNLKIPVIGLVKDNYHKTEYLLDTDENKIVIKSNVKLYNFLASIQLRVDEYAKSGFRKKQNTSFLRSEFESIPGMGKKRLQELFKGFNTISDMKAATSEELNKVLKNKKLTSQLMDYLQNREL